MSNSTESTEWTFQDKFWWVLIFLALLTVIVAGGISVTVDTRAKCQLLGFQGGTANGMRLETAICYLPLDRAKEIVEFSLNDVQVDNE
jgi:hypothetical protein